MNLFKKLQAIALLFVILFFGASRAFAAAPDGAGPWADSVLTFSQGLMKNGGAVPAIRSDTSTALGVAENDTVDGNFFSLGFGGTISLGFDNGISGGTMIIEATNPDYPIEAASIEMSEDGITWVAAGTVFQDGVVDQPQEVACAKYIRITDISEPANYPDDIADGYDVDGVQAIGESCTPTTPTPTPTSTPTGTSTPTSTPSSSSTPSPSTPGFPDTGGCTSSGVSSVPTILEISRVSTTSIFVSWGPDAGYDDFVVQYGFENGVWLFSTNVTGFSTTINDLPANQPIWVRVAATDNCATGAFSGSVFSGGGTGGVPGFPDTGTLIPRLPNTGFGQNNMATIWSVLATISLGIGIYYLARRTRIFSGR